MFAEAVAVAAAFFEFPTAGKIDEVRVFHLNRVVQQDQRVKIIRTGTYLYMVKFCNLNEYMYYMCPMA